jgi:hypothetical protein
VAVVEAFTAGEEGLEAGDDTIRAFHVFLKPGYERAPDTIPLVSETTTNAVHALASVQIRQGRVERMRELAPTATFVTLAPFVGAKQACAVANG